MVEHWGKNEELYFVFILVFFNTFSLFVSSMICKFVSKNNPDVTVSSSKIKVNKLICGAE